jgi:hypothetical protein
MPPLDRFLLNASFNSPRDTSCAEDVKLPLRLHKTNRIGGATVAHILVVSNTDTAAAAAVFGVTWTCRCWYQHFLQEKK